MLRRIAVIVASLSLTGAAAIPAFAFDEAEGVVAKIYVSIPLGGGGGDGICSRYSSFGRTCSKKKCIKLGGIWAGGICLKS